METSEVVLCGWSTKSCKPIMPTNWEQRLPNPSTQGWTPSDHYTARGEWLCPTRKIHCWGDLEEQLTEALFTDKEINVIQVTGTTINLGKSGSLGCIMS